MLKYSLKRNIVWKMARIDDTIDCGVKKFSIQYKVD